MIYVLGGGGGLAVPFRVFRGISAPSSPKAFDLWIKTSTTVSNCQLRNTTYTTSVAGQMIIHYETTIDGNCAATSASPSLFMVNQKVNSLPYRMPIKLTACKISTGSGWQNVDAYIYKNAQWVQFSSAWNGELYDAGNEFVSATGGWTVAGYTGFDVPTSGELKTDHIYFPTGSARKTYYAGTQNAVDLTGWSQINMSYATSASGSQSTISLDVASITGAYYVAVTNYVTFDGTTFNVGILQNKASDYLAKKTVDLGGAKYIYKIWMT